MPAHCDAGLISCSNGDRVTGSVDRAVSALILTSLTAYMWTDFRLFSLPPQGRQFWGGLGPRPQIVGRGSWGSWTGREI